MILASPRKRRTDRRRHAILEAALTCFARQGFAATTMADVRRAARASIGSIYHHFTSKEQLAGALFVEGLRDYQEGLLAHLARERRREGTGSRQQPNGDPRRMARHGIKSIVEHYLRWVEAHPDWARYLLEMGHAQSVVAVRHEIAELNHRFYGGLEASFAPHIERGDLARLPMELYLALLVGPARDFARHWLRGAKVNIREARRVLADAAWKSLRTRTTKE